MAKYSYIITSGLRGFLAERWHRELEYAAGDSTASCYGSLGHSPNI